jgi:hypothetical protein
MHNHLSEPEYLFRFADRDMLMRYHWSLGVGHAYAYHTTKSVEETPPDSASDFSGEATLNALHQSEPENVIRGYDHIDGDEDGSDGNSSFTCSSVDLDDSDNSDVEIAAMYNWDSQDEGEEEYKF